MLFNPKTLKTDCHCCDCTSCRTLFSQRDLGVVGSEAGEVLLLAGEQSQQHDVSRGQEGQRVMGVSTLPEEGPQKQAAVRTCVYFYHNFLFFYC